MNAMPRVGWLNNYIILHMQNTGFHQPKMHIQLSALRALMAYWQFINKKN